jgi:hypothetical protein
MAEASQVGGVSWERRWGPSGYRCFSRPREEYTADFFLVSARALRAYSELFRVFRLHHLAGLDWRVCCELLGVGRGKFYHLVYEIEGRIGRVLAELEPYSLYPVSEYFAISNEGTR